MDKKIYIEHETSVRFMEQYINKNNDWQWFIDLIEEEFELIDVTTWKEYLSLFLRYGQLYSYLEKMIEVGEPRVAISNVILGDLYKIANYRIGSVTISEARNGVFSTYGKMFLLVVWVTKLENQNGKTNILYDNDLFDLNNVWQIRSLENLSLYSEDIICYAEKIPLEDISCIVRCLADNINRKNYPCREEFANELSSCYSEKDFFDFGFDKIIPKSWQERFVLSIIHQRISDGKFPIERFFPTDMSEKEIRDNLVQIRSYFSCPLVDFIIDSVVLFAFDSEPSVETKRKYFEIWCNVFQNSDEFKRLSGIGFIGVAKLFACKMIKNVSDTDEFREFIKKLGGITSLYEIEKITSAKLPLTPKQREIIKEYHDSAYKKIDGVNDVHTLLNYLENNIVCQSINDEYFLKVRDKFEAFLDDESAERMLPRIFYKFMAFLICVKNVGSVSKRIVEVTIIGTQRLWEEKYYAIVLNGMQSFKSKTQIANEQVQSFNDEVLKNPLIFAKACINLDEDNVCANMENASNHPLMHMFTQMMISKLFPIENPSISLEKHDVDCFLQEYISRIEEKKSYRFLNRLGIDKYMASIYEEIHSKCRLMISMLYEEEKLYELVAKESTLPLLPYKNDLYLGHVTQLFPILEKKVRTVSSLFGVAPFKEDMSNFMQYKDPSSLLREMIKAAYEETKSFELVYDLMFVYCMMYNSNSLNIRNECIHGRGYDTGNELRFAFRVTLMCIYLMDYRYKLVCQNCYNSDSTSNEE